MTKKIAVINDLSGFGRCSLTAAISVISAMGVQPCPLPTAILTAQTGYPSYYCDDYTDKMDIFRNEWQKMNAQFDGIYTGFVASETQIEHIFHFIDTFDTDDTFLLVDPVMGDDGKKYAMFTSGLLEQMKRLAEKADIITPNLTELCLLGDADFQEIRHIPDQQQMLDAIEKLARSLYGGSDKHVIVTGIHHTDSGNVSMMGNLYLADSCSKLCSFPHIGGSYSGTGDLFASCIAAGVARGDTIPDIIHLAGEFLELALKNSVREGVPRNDGTNFEQYLPMLMQFRT